MTEKTWYRGALLLLTAIALSLTATGPALAVPAGPPDDRVVIADAVRDGAVQPDTLAGNTDFIAVAGPAAQPGQAEFGVPASVTVAQAILESNWGRSAPGNNYFGIKCGSGGHGPIAIGCQDLPTQECDPGCHTVIASFRVYASMTDSFRDHGLFLRSNHRYDPAFDYPDNPDQFIREVAKAGYATDPNYAGKVIGLMGTYDLYRFNTPAPPPLTAGISVGSDGTQLILSSKDNGTVLAKKGLGLYGWTLETDPVVKKVATNGGVQLILTKDGTVLAKDTIGLYEWTVETDAVVKDIAVGSDGTQLILDNTGVVLAKKGIGLYGWTAETDAVVKQIATNGGVQLILDNTGTVLAKNSIGQYGWTAETDAVVRDIAVGSDGTQLILDNTGVVLAKKDIGLYGWTAETDAVVSDIAAGADGTQLILDRTGTVLAKNTIGLYGWTVETDAVVKQIATNGGVQLILDNTGRVLAKDSIGQYGWTLESDPIA
ncbi:glucosaminidase domain-containing protein [Amycolatopsis vancoresmycina]|uniref:glucosaminidase domain-containing protein n=1 Tax=Amycolatopsis vancoresmycina TaxID=208444 RepID=UPI00068FB7EA|nr:glucosaminidase domain-containing protein [Amycolatopsis vancoresmycina]